MDCKFPQHHGGDGGGGGIAGALIVILAAVVGVAITPLLHILAMVLEVGVPVVALGGAATLVLMARRRVSRREVGTSPLAAVLSPARPRRQALPQQQDGGVHYHLHGMTPEAVRHVLGQQADTKWTASIEKD